MLQTQKHKRPSISMSNKDKIDQILLLSEEVRKDTGQSPLYNYGYREIMHREVLRKIFPSLQRSLGSHGSDANTDEIDFIEFKSGFWTKNKCFSPLCPPKSTRIHQKIAIPRKKSFSCFVFTIEWAG